MIERWAVQKRNLVRVPADWAPDDHTWTEVRLTDDENRCESCGVSWGDSDDRGRRPCHCPEVKQPPRPKESVMDEQEVIFAGTIKVTTEDLQEAEGDLLQAVQNLVGLTGAQVMEVRVR